MHHFAFIGQHIARSHLSTVLNTSMLATCSMDRAQGGLQPGGGEWGAPERQSQTEAEESATPALHKPYHASHPPLGSSTRTLTNLNRKRTRSSAWRRGGLPVRWLGSARPGSRLLRPTPRRSLIKVRRRLVVLSGRFNLYERRRRFCCFFFSFSLGSLACSFSFSVVSSAHTRTRRGATSRVGW